jgi:hypothetical protein
MTPSHRQAMERAIHLDLTAPGPIDHSPACECGCGTRIGETGYLIDRKDGAVYRPEHFEAAQKLKGKCLFCGAPALNDFCSDSCYYAWDRRGLEEDEADHAFRAKVGD